MNAQAKQENLNLTLMPSKNQVFILLLTLLTLSSITKPSHADDCPENIPGGKMAVYWGQHNDLGEGTLAEACDSDLYNITAIAYLHVSHSKRSLDLSDHCLQGDCTTLAPQIKHCQSKGIQVLLSVEVDAVDDPNSLASYLYDNFLSGKSGPLGAVALDGIDFAHFEYSSEPWHELVGEIRALADRKIYITGAPYCHTTLDSTVEKDDFDYIWVLYYGQWDSCKYLGNGGFKNLLESWATWTSKPVLADTSMFLGLVASDEPSAASYGYIPPEKFMSEVLPAVMESSNFGGVMLWNRYYDKETGYSAEIKDAFGSKVCECVCIAASSRRFNSFLAKSL